MMKDRGHQVILTLAPGWKSLVEKHGYEFIPFQYDESRNDGTTSDPTKSTLNSISEILREIRLTPMEYVQSAGDNCGTWINWHDMQFPANDALAKVIQTVRPDMIVVDALLRLPCLEKSTIPWAQLWSCNPIVLYFDHYPPQSTGWPTDSSRELWDEYRTLRDKKYQKLYDYVRSWIIQKGIEDHEDAIVAPPFITSQSKWINFYTYPSFLDYDAPRLPRWVRMDTSVREPDDTKPFEVPECLRDRTGKLIYFSLGTLGSVDLELMKRVISVLAQSPHRFIVSKGPLHEQIELPENMWGDKYVNQIAILPHCDLVITHGGNNTLTESLYFGRPMVVMPIMYDQRDNAQRVVEKGVGLRIDPYRFKDSELLEAIEKLLNDEELKERLSTISIELKESTIKTKETVCQLIEETAASGRSPFDVVNNSNNQNQIK